MGIIKKLTSDVINHIAAGEVIESPFSVVKEMIENSIDAGATAIEVETRSGGLEKIVIADNGGGVAADDLDIILERHSTSKIEKTPDLEEILTYGFRGEAISSIASVSKMNIVSGTNSGPATELRSEKGEITEKRETVPFKGTKMEVRDLFYNTPVRRKFIKSVRSEDRKIKERVIISALSHPEIAFRLVQDDRETVSVQPEETRERIVSLFGEGIRDHLLEVSLAGSGLSASGFITGPDFYRSNRTGQYIFINQRPVEIKYSSQMLKKCYGELLPHGAHPWCFLFFDIDPRNIDVNVHPAKREIRFLDEQRFNGFFISLINSKLRSDAALTITEVAPVLKNRSALPQSAGSSPGFQEFLHRDVFSSPAFQQGYETGHSGAGARVDELNQNRLVNPEFIPKRHFGLLFDTFILAEGTDGLYIIDQHTAHERIRYEEILNKIKNSSYNIQSMLTPIRVDLSADDMERLAEIQDDLKSAGFDIEPLDASSAAIRAVPDFIDSGREKEIFMDFLERSKTGSELYDELAKSIACRFAIKKGDQLSDQLLAELLNRLSYCDNPSRCPHGRPTLVKVTRDDLEKMFHRK